MGRLLVYVMNVDEVLLEIVYTHRITHTFVIKQTKDNDKTKTGIYVSASCS